MNSHTCSLQCDIWRGEIRYGIADAGTREGLQKLSPTEGQTHRSKFRHSGGFSVGGEGVSFLGKR
jgi:hypothetical protein